MYLYIYIFAIMRILFSKYNDPIKDACTGFDAYVSILNT